MATARVAPKWKWHSATLYERPDKQRPRERETKMKKKIKQRNTIGQLPTTKILMNKYRWEGGYKRNLNRIFSHKV